jgi:glycosyltransferase involved in cell wall biosynthesis
VYVANGYPPRHVAGTESYTASIAAGFARAGHRVRVIVAGDFDAGPQAFNGSTIETIDGVEVIRLNLNWQLGPNPNRFLFDNPLVETFIAEQFASDRPDLVHVTSAYTLSASVLRAAKAKGLPLVVTLTDFWFICPRVILMRADGSLCSGQTTPWECLRCTLQDSRLFRRAGRLLPDEALRPVFTWASRQPALSRQRGLRGLALDMEARKQMLPGLLRQADAIISPSRYLAQVFQANGLALDAHIIPYVHQLDWVGDLQPRHARPPLVFGYVGRIVPAKGVHVLGEAVRRLAPDLPAQVVVWGDASQEPEYAAALPQAGPGRLGLEFRGSFDRSQLAQVYSQMDVLVVPSIWHENTPLVIQEAFAAGIPVIASDVGGMAEVVQPEVNGLLFAPGDASGLAAAITRMSQEEGLLHRLKAGIPPVPRVETGLGQLEAVYQDVLAHRTANPAGASGRS